MQKKLLITGGNGLVGKLLLKKLGQFAEIHALVRAFPEVKQPNVIYYLNDFSIENLPDNLPAQMDGIIHLAQSNNIRQFPQSALEMFNVNVKSTALLLAYGKQAGVTHFIYTSTGGIYGPTPEPIKEHTAIQLPQGDLSYYFAGKYASENLIKAYSDQFYTQILRPFFIYGPGQRKEMLIPRLIDNIAQQKPISLQGENGICINPVYVTDVVDLILQCLKSNQHLTLNAAGSELISLREISELIATMMNKKPNFIYVDDKPNHILGDNQLMRELLQKPLTTFRTGVSNLITEQVLTEE